MLPLISLIVIITVFWWLKLIGITMAGEAFCGLHEHVHENECIERVLICTESDTDEENPHEHTNKCYSISYICGMEEHIHDEMCYSDIKADVETPDMWEATLPDIHEDATTAERVVEIARSQLGYAESERNFAVDLEGVRHGYTRYGEWYGNTYGNWSVMFVSFCLRYAGLEDVPINSGAEAMIVEWNREELYKGKDNYTPIPGDVVFLDKNQNGVPESAAIVIEVELESIIVIEGDCDGIVAENEYAFDDETVVGFGLSAPKNSLIIIEGEETDVPETDAPETDAPETDVPETDVPETDAPETDVPETDVPETDVPETDAPETDVPETDVPETDVPETDAPETDVPETDAPETDAPETDVPETDVPETDVPETDAPETDVPETDVPETDVPETDAPETDVPETDAPETDAPETDAPETDVPETDVPEKKPSLELEADSEVKLEGGDEEPDVEITAVGDTYSVWLDGTNGGLRSLSGSPNTRYAVKHGDTIQLPTEWQSPNQFGYRVRGWYDVTNSVYYRPGEEVTVLGNMVLYTDWEPITYDIGRFNASTSDTISTNHIIDIHVFDYNYLFNILSSKASVNVSTTSHSETWSHVSSGTVPYKNAETIDFIFKDNDSGGKLSLANNRSYNNDYHQATTVSDGIYTPELGEILFGHYNSFDPETGEGILGKTYLGRGDHLFQLMENPASEYYGYYYFDSKLHAASYNRSEQRFYVYDYLARTSDSTGQSGEYGYSDFLPMNSPYANTNGKGTDTYTYEGDLGEYDGVNHYEYDVSYNNSSIVGANMAFGMSMEMKFYLPDTPGERNENGEYANLDIYGNEMVYTFSGDDDVWVLVDGVVRLDIGGIHQVVSGTINFSSGIVTVNGRQTDTLSDLEPGDHVLTVYYLERGSSQSNCAMYFNIAPRYSLTLQKEDVLTQELLDGAEFTFYNDLECTEPAMLWGSEEDYDNEAPSQSTFTVVNGIANIWGISPGKTYYIKETKAPDNPGYECAVGIIKLVFDIKGNATFDLEIIEEEEGEGISPGYTVHGYHIDTDDQDAYITITNAQEWVDETTTIQVYKVWDDTEDHSTDYVSVYLTVTDEDGTVRRIREIVLGEENEWTYTWTNLPKHGADGVTEVDYGVEESYTTGYQSMVERVEKIIINDEAWESYQFENGGEYLLKTSYGFLSTVSSSSDKLKWISEEEAKAEYGTAGSLATWTAEVNTRNSTVKLTNGAGQILTFNTSSSRRYFYAYSRTNSYQNLTYTNTNNGYRLAYKSGNTNTSRYATSLNNNGYLASHTNDNNALLFTPMVVKMTSTEIEVEGIAYTITNTPLEAETSLKVTKYWDTGLAQNVKYETAQVTIKLYADGKDTGRSVTLSLKNSWTETFMGLPYQGDDGHVISYTVVEAWDSNDWEPKYGEILSVGNGIPTYETSVTNTYKFGHGYELPSTGGCGAQLWVLSGLALMLGSLVSLYIIKRRSLRRKC